MSDIDRIAPAQRPSGQVVMRPQWHDLLFLHWPFESAFIQSLLPEGLEIDSFEGRAWVGLVPFRMSHVRPYFIPNLNGISHFYEAFPELNVRTYVVKDGVPGVWFFSLDCASLPATMTARLWFKLPYFKARMSLHRPTPDTLNYRSQRLYPKPLPARTQVSYRVAGEARPAEVGSLEHFLVERYVLYSQRGQQLFRGRVHHAPYQLQNAAVLSLRDECVACAIGTQPIDQPHAIYAKGVEVEVFGLEKC